MGTYSSSTWKAMASEYMSTALRWLLVALWRNFARVEFQSGSSHTEHFQAIDRPYRCFSHLVMHIFWASYWLFTSTEQLCRRGFGILTPSISTASSWERVLPRMCAATCKQFVLVHRVTSLVLPRNCWRNTLSR